MPTSGALVSTSGRSPNASRSTSTTASLTFSAANPECVSPGVSRTLPCTDSVLLPVSQSLPADGARAVVQALAVVRVDFVELQQHAHRDARVQADAHPHRQRPFEPDAALVALGARDPHRRELAPQRTLGAGGAGHEETKHEARVAVSIFPTPPPLPLTGAGSAASPAVELGPGLGAVSVSLCPAPGTRISCLGPARAT